ncbi:MAG: YhgE/Pip domain-containing protein [Liquorilactobacillus hordei]|uniref:YhgE/Pip family protein n=1 Tax=Liquorilactobacillus hordei TaxID=468911 RepID=UPI0039ED560D
MIKEEFKNILNHKLLIVTILAIMFIPFLYSVFFLKSVWDPYGNAGSLPVAVVNEDKAVSYNGKKMQVGDKLVKELKKNDSLQWHFVSAKKALDGMKHKKYYTIITIPKNFSKNATTVLNKNPKKMRLTYKTNDSLNYIGKVISEEGAKQLNTKINATVTRAYAKTMFATIKQVGTGFTTASKGANKLKKGSTTLSDGINTYTAGVKKVNDGVIELQTGVVPLSQGVIKLATGSNTLASGLGTYTSGVGQVNSGLGTLNSKTSSLSNGVSQLTIGSNDLSTGLSQYLEKVSELNTGLGKASSSSDTLRSGANNLKELPHAAAALYVTNSVINNGIKQIKTGLSSDNVAELTSALQELQALANYYNTYSSTLKNLSNLKDSLSQVGKGLSSIATNSQAIGKAAATLQNDTTLSDADKNAVSTIIDSNNKNLTELQTLQTTLSTLNLSDAEKALNSLNALMSNADLTQEKLEALSSASTNLKNLSTAVSNLSEVSDSALSTAKELNTSVGNTDDFDASSLTDEDKITAAISKNDTGTNINSLIAGVNEYTAGVDQLADGSSQLNSKSSELTTGATGLSSGLSTLNSQIPSLTSGVSELFSGSSQLNSNSKALVSGASQLASGLNQLNSKVPTLSSGVNQLASGTSQLNANSSKLTQGSAKLADGNKALAKALGKGAKKVNAVKTSNKTANMFATPSKLTHKNYSTVPNYGYALAPYMLSVALYVGALVFNLVYPIRRLSTPDGTGTEWFLSKIAVGAVVATGTAVIETLLMMAVGLMPDHPFQMIINALIFSFTAMYLIMFLSVAGGNPGRFAAMILLVIQLGGSGGSFPIDITNGMNGFFQAINPFLPMTYSILGFREALTSGLGSNQVPFSVGIMLIFMIVSLLLLWATMVTKRKNGSVSYAEPATEEKE